MNEIVPRNVLMKQGTKAVGGIGGGVALLVLRGIGGLLVPGLIVGGVLTAVGIGISSKSKEDRMAGLITTAAGVLTAVASLPIVGGFAKGLMLIGGIGLLVAGGVSLYKFIKGLRSRN